MSNMNDSVNFPEHIPRKETLLDKYGIPIQHFEFDYVKKCDNANELEKILLVLRSGEEGHFPDLTKAVEEKLRIVKPKSKLLRTESRALNRDELKKEEYEEISNDLRDWLNEVLVNDNELRSRKTKSCGFQSSAEIRKPVNVNTTADVKEQRISSTDYSAWDKYDPDTEILKMDIEEEKQKTDVLETTKKIPKKSVTINEYTTEAEKNHFANQEREKGNEYFKNNEYEEALHYYTNSIKIKANVHNLNNRALTYLKLGKHWEAIEDCKKVLKMDENNVKALMKMAEALEKLKRFRQALDAVESAIQREPNNEMAQKLAERVREKLGKSLKTTRITITEIE